MKAELYHIQLNVSNAKRSIPFYRALLGKLGWKRIIDQGKDYIGIGGKNTDFWIIETERRFRQRRFHRKQTGINHLAFRVSSRGAVDRFTEEFLKPRRIRTLYGTPKEFPEYHKGYYAVFFEDPDRVKLEVAYVP
jgi:catechol 2,3-dioxygenase-like lactoylglutathione lyase family enzyme